MGMKLYYGGCGPHQEFVVAEDADKASVAIGIKINAPFLPITVEEISEVDGFIITPLADVPCEMPTVEVNEEQIAISGAVASEVDEVIEVDKPVTLRHCKLCDFTCESQGELMRHYKECHPKGA